MKKLLTTMAASTAVIFSLAITTMPVAQADYYYSTPGGMMAWGFKTLEQCQASDSTLGGSCNIDPSPYATSTTANAYAYSPKSVRHHRK